MKKLLCMILAVMLMMTLFTACFEEDYETEEMTDATVEDATAEDGTAEDDMMVEDDEVSYGVAADGTPFGSFTATSVYGHEVTEAVFGEYDMTMVNVWATWCPPCIGEMDELEEVYQALPASVNVLTLCDDGDVENALALQILEENGCNFDAIVPDDAMRSGFMSTVSAFPTTVFVDSAGNIFGDRIEGAPQDPVAYYMAAAEAMLEMIEE